MNAEMITTILTALNLLLALICSFFIPKKACKVDARTMPDRSEKINRIKPNMTSINGICVPY